MSHNSAVFRSFSIPKQSWKRRKVMSDERIKIDILKMRNILDRYLAFIKTSTKLFLKEPQNLFFSAITFNTSRIIK